jgi:hypothetical protein
MSNLGYGSQLPTIIKCDIQKGIGLTKNPKYDSKNIEI